MIAAHPGCAPTCAAWGWQVSKKTVEASMARQGLVGRPTTAPVPFSDPPRQGRRAAAGPRPPGLHGAGDQRQVVWRSDRGVHRRRQALPGDTSRTWCRDGSPASPCPSITPARAALQMAAAVRGGDVKGVIFHSDRGSEYTAELFETACRRLGVRQSMGRVGSCFDNAAVGELPLDTRVRATPQAPLRHQAASPGGGRRLHRPLQPHPPTQHL